MKNETGRRECSLQYDKVFEVNGNQESCHHTGYEVCFGDTSSPAEWWCEYEDSDGDFHYGR